MHFSFFLRAQQRNFPPVEQAFAHGSSVQPVNVMHHGVQRTDGNEVGQIERIGHPQVEHGVASLSVSFLLVQVGNLFGRKDQSGSHESVRVGQETQRFSFRIRVETFRAMAGRFAVLSSDEPGVEHGVVSAERRYRKSDHFVDPCDV